MTNFSVEPTKTVVILGGSYGGNAAAALLAKRLPRGWKLLLIDRNSHINHVYSLPRFGILPGHEHKAFIPYDRVFDRDTLDGPDHEFIHGQVVSLSPYSITLHVYPLNEGKPAAPSPFPSVPATASCYTRTRTRPNLRRITFDYLIYALGSHFPAPINLWGPVPSPAIVDPPTVFWPKAQSGYQGGKNQASKWLRKHQQVVKRARSVLVVGGGPLGIQYATDIKSVHPEKRVTLLHSRAQLLPRFSEALHDAAKTRIEEAGIRLILGKRLDLKSVHEIPARRNEAGERIVRTVDGEECETDLIFLCTGQVPNTSLLDEMDSRVIVPETKQARVLRTMQLGLVSPSPSSTGSESETTPYPHIFAVGDAADAFGAIQAGHMSYYQAELAARNIVKMIEHQASLEKGSLSSEKDNEPELEEYYPKPPSIKVTFGLGHAVSQQQDGSITVNDDASDDLDARGMWGLLGHPNPSDEEMRR
ncbi:FAD/NAD(P)-binding domain-containing protein [Clavulina sp. PMI_390]|nr:FAD/NAD(P)-binding domain-containing protein [Clavulina sp. PMI_390]